MIPNKLRVGLIKANNQPVATRGLVTTTAGPDLCHTLPIGRTVIIRKIMYYNNVGANVLLNFGTLTNAGVFFPLLPTILALNTFDAWYEEEHVPDVEFANDRTAAAAGVNGNIMVQAVTGGGAVAGVLIRLTVEEFGR